MKKKTIANIVMVLIIVSIVTLGMLYVGYIKGWFDKVTDDTSLLTDFRGIITLEREGVAYNTSKDTVLRNGDVIKCSTGATVKISIIDGYVILGSSAEVEIIESKSSELSMNVLSGEVFIDTVSKISVEFEGKKQEISNAVANLSVRKGAQSISVYYGEIEGVCSGQLMEWIDKELFIRKLSISSLNDFNITQIRKANDKKTLIFTNEELNSLEEERWNQLLIEEQTDASQSIENECTEVTTENSTENVSQVVNTENQESTNRSEITKEESTTQKGTTEKETTEKETTKSKENFEEKQTKDEEGSVKKETTKKETTKKETSKKETTQKEETTSNAEKMLECMITIRCDTILNNWSELDMAKAVYVPENGCILPVVTVKFSKGETVFDVLNRVCKQYNIQIEYSWTPMYDSYYVEGIHNLYEFDCGAESGWMYKVNGWFPNYGCSSYELVGGESIVWCYTCKGLGEDVGAERME